MNLFWQVDEEAEGCDDVVLMVVLLSVVFVVVVL